jgi:hypothetical protein
MAEWEKYFPKCTLNSLSSVLGVQIKVNERTDNVKLSSDLQMCAVE